MFETLMKWYCVGPLECVPARLIRPETPRLKGHAAPVVRVRLLTIGAVVERILHLTQVSIDGVHQCLAGRRQTVECNLTDDPVAFVAPRDCVTRSHRKQDNG